MNIEKPVYNLKFIRINVCVVKVCFEISPKQQFKKLGFREICYGHCKLRLPYTRGWFSKCNLKFPRFATPKPNHIKFISNK